MLYEQYNGMAHKYAEIVQAYNQDSIGAYFSQFTFPLKGKKVLDLGCGHGDDLEKISSLGADIYGIDSSAEMVAISQQLNPDGHIQLGSFDAIPFPDGFFDVVVSKWALQMASNMNDVYREIARVLKPQGQLLYLTSHPMRQFIEKKRSGKNYFEREIVESSFFDGKITVREPSHTMNELLGPTFFEYFQLEAFEEGFDSGAEKVNMDIYPSYVIIRGKRL